MSYPDTDRTRRSFLQKAGATFTTSLLAFDVGAAQGTGYAKDDVRRYGVAPNSAAAASANTAALKALVDPAETFSGRLSFPNTTGSDVYYFNDLIAFHDGVHLDLKGSTLSFSKIGGPRDTDSGFIHAIRDFVIENGALVTTYQFNGGHKSPAPRQHVAKPHPKGVVLGTLVLVPGN